MAYAIYARVSQDRTGEQASVERQQKACHDLARRHKLRGTPDVYVDNDTSASDRRRKRPQYEQLLAALGEGRYTELLIWHPDRLHRRPIELERFIDAIEQHPLRILTAVSGNIDLGTGNGRMIARLLGATARGEMETKSDRQKSALAAKRAAGGRTSGFRSFGYNGDRVIQAEARAIRMACTRILRGESTTSIWRSWNKRGLLTPRGNRWDGTTFRNMIKRPALCGLVTYKGEVVPDVRGTWKPILDEDIWQAVQAVISDPARNTSPGPAPKHLSSGVTYCECGRTMRSGINSTKSKRTGLSSNFAVYRCSSGQSGHSSIKKEILDEAVHAAVVDAMWRRQNRPPAPTPDDAELRELLSQRTRLDESEERLLDAIVDAPTPRAKQRLTALQRDRAELEGRIARARQAFATASTEDEWIANTWAENAGRPILERGSDGLLTFNAAASIVAQLERGGMPRGEAVAKAELGYRFGSAELEVRRALIRSTVRVTVNRAPKRGMSGDRIAIVDL